MFLLYLKHEIKKNVASLGSSILASGLISVRLVTWSWTVDLKVSIPATPWSQTPSQGPAPRASTPASHVSHQSWRRRLSWLWLCLSSLPCTGPQTFPAAFFRDALPDGSMDILAFLLSVTMPPISPASCPYCSLKSRGMGKEPMLSPTQLLSQSCSLPPNNRLALLTDLTGPREFLKWHQVNKDAFSVSDETQLLTV